MTNPRYSHSSSSVLSLVLVIEHRECLACGARHTAPNHFLMARIHDRDRPRASRLVKFTSDIPFTYATPRIREHITTTADACHLCFDHYEPEDQLELWPREEPQGLTHNREAAARRNAREERAAQAAEEKKLVPLELSDF